VQPDLPDSAFASAGVGDYYPPQLLAAAAEHWRCFGEQGVVADASEEIGVVVDAHDVPGAVERLQATPAGDGFHDGAVRAAMDEANCLPQNGTDLYFGPHAFGCCLGELHPDVAFEHGRSGDVEIFWLDGVLRC
jgi:hypothetical protein